MIIRRRPPLRDLLLAAREPVLSGILGPLAAVLLLALAAVPLARTRPEWLQGLSAMPVTLIGLTLAIVLSLRAAGRHDRWRAGEALCRDLATAARSFARLVTGLEPAEREALLLGVCAFAGGLAARLRGGDEAAAIGRWLPPGDWSASPNPTDAVLREIGAGCLALVGEGAIGAAHHGIIEGQLTTLAHVQAGCERIAEPSMPGVTPSVRPAAAIFCLLLPFALAPALGWWTPVPALLVAFALLGLDGYGASRATPYGRDVDDLALDSLVRTLERELLASVGHGDLPPPSIAALDDRRR